MIEIITDNLFLLELQTELTAVSPGNHSLIKINQFFIAVSVSTSKSFMFHSFFSRI
jgi:hypothetical protein